MSILPKKNVWNIWYPKFKNLLSYEEGTDVPHISTIRCGPFDGLISFSNESSTSSKSYKTSENESSTPSKSSKASENTNNSRRIDDSSFEGKNLVLLIYIIRNTCLKTNK